MPGIISPLSASGAGTLAGMKRSYVEEAAPTRNDAHPKKRRVVHKLHHTQPVQHFVEPLGGGFGAADDQEFVDAQLRRAIAIQCKAVGFDTARPEAVESMCALLHQFMTNFTDQVRKSMSSARRTETLPHDWIYALTSTGHAGSSILEPHLDTGEVPPSILQPAFAPPEPADPAPPDVEGMLGPELSGRADKESRTYIPAHFPPFPPKHTWKATADFAKREDDPHKIRERAAKEGIDAEKSLRRLMDGKKIGIERMQREKLKLRRKQHTTDRERLLKEALKAAFEEEDAQEEQRKEFAEQRQEDGIADEDDEELLAATAEAKKAEQKPQTIEERLKRRVLVNYDRKFWRRHARDN